MRGTEVRGKESHPMYFLSVNYHLFASFSFSCSFFRTWTVNNDINRDPPDNGRDKHEGLGFGLQALTYHKFRREEDFWVMFVRKGKTL